MSDFAKSFDSIQVPAVAPIRQYAAVEIFGHRRHVGEIAEVEAFGTRLLEIHDADTHLVHRYGGAAIFSIAMLTSEQFAEHVESVRRRKERDAQLALEWAERRDRARDDEDDERPF